MAYPLIITLELEEKDKAYFTALRKTHFPGHANYLDAHLTLFYRLPSDEPAITNALMDLSARPAMLLEVNEVFHFGNGVAFRLVSEELQLLHVRMQEAFAPWLIRQDRQLLRPHITIQNKVTAFKAQQLHEKLQAGFEPYTIRATGLSTWHYLGGPWRTLDHYPFKG